MRALFCYIGYLTFNRKISPLFLLFLLLFDLDAAVTSASMNHFFTLFSVIPFCLVFARGVYTCSVSYLSDSWVICNKHLQELWSLLEFMMPDIFATGDVDLKKLLNAEDGDLISRIKSILGPFILRWLKSDVMQQLVPKIQNVSFMLNIALTIHAVPKCCEKNLLSLPLTQKIKLVGVWLEKNAK